jgi:hypothetical protein
MCNGIIMYDETISCTSSGSVVLRTGVNHPRAAILFIVFVLFLH